MAEENEQDGDASEAIQGAYMFAGAGCGSGVLETMRPSLPDGRTRRSHLLSTHGHPLAGSYEDCIPPRNVTPASASG